MFRKEEDWVHHAETRTREMGSEPLGELFFTFVEMRKWVEKGTLDSEDIRDAWMLFFTQPERMKDIYTPEQRQRYKEMWEAVRAWDLTKHSEHDLWIMDKKVQDMWTHEAYVLHAHDEGRQMGFENGVETLLGAFQHLKENPNATDEELMKRFSISAETVNRVRAMMLG